MKNMDRLDFLLSASFFMAVGLMFILLAVVIVIIPLMFVGHVIGMIF